MGTDYNRTLMEAHRILKLGYAAVRCQSDQLRGTLLVAEVVSRFDDVRDFLGDASLR